MNDKEIKITSKFLSLILRHQPEIIGLSLDENGWADTNTLLAQLTAHGHPVSKASLEKVVDTNDKKRFAFNEDHSRIRASQGHSVDVELNLQQQRPPEYLYHGTIGDFIDTIKAEGLQKMSRRHVHLSQEESTAKAVGGRRGKPVILSIRARQMQEAGFIFYLSENGVWLTDHVPAQYITF
jgi:putative RNA 2'-phosphotransferase